MCSIDATEDTATNRLGRLANHSKCVTAFPRLVPVQGIPHLCLFASRNLQSGEQVLYDYGVKLPFHDLVRNVAALLLYSDVSRRYKNKHLIHRLWGSAGLKVPVHAYLGDFDPWPGFAVWWELINPFTPGLPCKKRYNPEQQYHMTKIT